MAMQGQAPTIPLERDRRRDRKDYAPAHSTTVRCEFSQAHASRCKVQCIQLALQWSYSLHSAVRSYSCM